jgi:hypothetical protein
VEEKGLIMKVAINTCYGGFGLSDEAKDRYIEIKGMAVHKVKGELGFMNYLFAPAEEYQAQLAEDRKTRNYAKSTAMYFSFYNIERNDPALIQVIEEMGDAAAGAFADIKIVDIPDDVEYTIEEYDGKEWVAEVHRTWS